MRLALVSPLPPAHDGIADYTSRLVASLRASGHTVDTIGSHGRVTTDDDALGALSWSPIRMLRLVSSVRGRRIEVIHVQHGIATFGTSLVPLWLFVAACRLSRVSVVVTHHEVTRDIARLGVAGRVYYALVSRLASVVHVHTESARSAVLDGLRIPAHRVLTMPHPVFPLPRGTRSVSELTEEHALGGRRVLLLFGFIHVEKGLREAVEGLGVLALRSPELLANVTLVIAGEVRPRPAGFGRFEQADHDYASAVRRRVDALDLGGHVLFVGRVPDGDMAAWFALAEAALLPYTQSEQSGVANLAVAAGTPVLTSRNGGLGELFGGVLPTFASLEPNDIAEALEQHLVGRRTRQDYAGAYTRIVDNASPAALVAQLSSMLRLEPKSRQEQVAV